MPIFQTRLSDWDPARPIVYVDLISRLLRCFRSVTGHEEFIGAIGTEVLRDISDRPDIREMDAQDPLPTHFHQKSYQYRGGRSGEGVLEATFAGSQLVNVRAQYFLVGWFGKRKAKKYTRNVLIPSLQIALGSPIERASDQARFSRNGIIVIARYVPGTRSVSTYLVDQRFA